MIRIVRPLVRRAFDEYATGRHTKEQLLKRARNWRLTNRRGKPLTSQAIGMLLRNQLYAGIVDVPEYGVRGKRGDFEPLIDEDLFYQVQAVRAGRAPITAPRQRAHPDFPLRGFVRCESCGRGLTGCWSKGRSDYYAYYHCRPGCRAVNVTKATLEGLFADELALLQPTPGYMRLLKESVLQIWKGRRAAVREELANAERAAKAIQDKLDRLDEAFLFERSIDIETYDRHAEKLREELTVARIERRSGQLEELDVEGILAFAERILPRAADLWVQASLDQRQRFQQLFFPDGIAFDGNRFVGTGANAPAFSYLRKSEPEMKVGGPDGSRTRDLMNAIHARSQLRYWPTLGRNVQFTTTERRVSPTDSAVRAERSQTTRSAHTTWRHHAGHRTETKPRADATEYGKSG